MAASIFEQLFELQWRGMGLPCKSIKTTGGHDTAEHKRVDRDGAHIENTGRNPYVFAVSLAFINGLDPGPSESWSGDLFPGLFRQFISACEDRTSGTLKHPIFGDINCKAISWDIPLEAEVRGGVYVDATFKESNDTDTATSLGAADAFTLASVAAADLDDALGRLKPTPKKYKLDNGSFTDFVNSITSVGDKFTQLGNKVLGQIDSVISALDEISDAFGASTTTSSNVNLKTSGLQPLTSSATVDAGQGFTATGDDGTTTALGVSASRIVDSANQLRAGLALVKTQAFVADKTIGFHVVLRRSTLGALAGHLKNSIDDLINLNTALLGVAIIRKGALVRYYKT